VEKKGLKTFTGGQAAALAQIIEHQNKKNNY
jgi:hypothetical protein